jgi:hypothetical protein
LCKCFWDIQVLMSDGSLLTETWLKSAGYRPILGKMSILYPKYLFFIPIPPQMSTFPTHCPFLTPLL